MNDETIKILFIPDIVGRAARRAVGMYLNKKNDVDFVVANVENASHGFGLTLKNYKELSEYGVDAMTSGNHIWDKKDIFEYINDADKLVRPLNYPKGTPGVGYRIFEKNGVKIAVVNMLGRVFMTPMDSPWECLKEAIEEIKKETSIIILDFHAEATAEKICFGKYASSLGVSAFFGTHTHVQTADEKIINNMAFITDAGFCGNRDGVIGMEFETSFKRLSTSLPEHYAVAESGEIQLDTVEVVIDKKTGNACDIKRFCLIVNIEKETEACCDKTITNTDG